MKQVQALPCNRPIVGRRICLERLRADHTDTLLASFDNRRFWNACRVNPGYNTSREKLANQLDFEYHQLPGQLGKLEWLISYLTKHDDGSSSGIPQQQFSDHRRVIGMASLSAFHSAHKRAEFLIGFFNPDEIQQGVSVEASLLVMQHAFYREGLHKLVSYVYAGNARAQKSTLALGFRNEGLLKEHIRTSGDRYTDVCVNGLLRNDFRQNKRLSRLSRYLLGYDVTIDSDTNTIKSDPFVDEFQISARFTLNR